MTASVKSSVPLRERLHIGVLVLLLVLLAIFTVVSAVDADRWYPMVLAAGVLITAFGAALGQRWSSVSIYIIAAALSVEWIGAVGLGYFRGTLALRLKAYSPLEVVFAFIPAVAYFSLIGYCCFVARRYVGSRRQPM